MKIAAISIADYAEATEGMPHDAERLFIRILLKMYSREDGLPDSDEENSVMFGYKSVRPYRRLKEALLSFPCGLYIDGDTIRHERVEDEIENVKLRRQQHAQNGSKGGRPKNVSAEFDESLPEVLPKFAPSLPETLPKQCADQQAKSITYENPSPSPSPSPSERKKNISLEVEASFEAFWSAYPRKTGRAQALKKFTAIISSGHATAEQLISAAKARVGITSTDQKFIPFAATWLNQARWTDVASKTNGAANVSLNDYFAYEADNDSDADDARHGHNAEGLCGRQAPDDVPELFAATQTREPEKAGACGLDRSQRVASVLHPLRVEGGAI
jgi:uncharacterized protein YdaU (DUF1376 family)